MKHSNSHSEHHHHHEPMKAVEFEGKPFSMSVKTLPMPKITQPTDAVIRITSSGICGTDLHTFHDRLPVTPPMTMGHEIVGVVHTIGSKVHNLKVGDRVIVSGVIFEDELDGNDQVLGGLGFGYFPGIKQFNGGQAEFIRVPFASDNLLLLPEGKEHELDYVLLADIFPTANWALDCSGFLFGDVVVVFGAGKIFFFASDISLYLVVLLCGLTDLISRSRGIALCLFCLPSWS
jgi:threonine dehydrogenase-like Zn-dependent dehydrogenase